MQSHDAFMLDSVADRFEVLLRRYRLFLKDLPQRFGRWASHQRSFATFESACVELFPEMLSSMQTELPCRWSMAVACVALKHYVSGMQSVELSTCGKALKILDSISGSTPSIEIPTTTENPLQISARNAALEVQIADLLRQYSTSETKKGRESKRLKIRPIPEGDPEEMLAYVAERRAEAMDVFLALRKKHAKCASEERRLRLANEEISRLKIENEALRRSNLQACTKGFQDSPSIPVLPKRALSLAGYWNLLPNDLLSVTPALIEEVERRGGEVIRREGKQACFAA